MRFKDLAVGAMLALALGGLSCPAAQAGIINAGTEKLLVYEQPGPSTIALVFGDVSASIGFGTGDFDGGTAIFPGPYSPQSLFAGGNCPPAPACAIFGGDSLTLAGLDAEFPSGTYVLTGTNSVTLASQTVDVNYDSSFASTAIPAFDAATYTGLPSADPSLPFALSFNDFTPDAGSTSSGTVLDIFDSTRGRFIIETELAPSATSFVLNAGTLKSGHQYSYYLAFDEQAVANSGGIITSDTSVTVTEEGFTAPGVLAVPEPSTWALMLTGGAAIGAAFRASRRRGASPFAAA